MPQTLEKMTFRAIRMHHENFITYDANKSVSESYAADKIDGVKALMKEKFREELDLEKIAQDPE